MTSLLLDTHAWIWLAAGDPRMAAHERLFNRAATEGRLLLATISLYEAALIGTESESGQRRGRQAVRMRPTVSSWIRDALRGTRVVPVNLEAEMATDAATFHAMHGDPFDRMIVAAAVHSRAKLVTADAKIHAFAARAGVVLFDL